MLDKMANAAAALGWPEQVVDVTRAQMQAVAEMQTKTMENIREAWEEQLMLPHPTAITPDLILSKLKSVPGFGPTASWPNADVLQAVATAPLAFWMEFGKHWQKLWLETLEKAQKG